MIDAERRTALEVIAAEVRDCTRCRLHETRRKAVPGEGDPDTEVVFVGEGPGQNEDREGRPFIGRAGDLLVKLLRHDLPLVVPVCLTRSAPFPPVSFTERVGYDRYLPLYLPSQDSEGLVELVAGGTAGMLIHRSVLEAMEPPWFEYGFASEDILFCNKAQDLGFTLHCDLSARLGTSL